MGILCLLYVSSQLFQFPPRRNKRKRKINSEKNPQKSQKAKKEKRMKQHAVHHVYFGGGGWSNPNIWWSKSSIFRKWVPRKLEVVRTERVCFPFFPLLPSCLSPPLFAIIFQFVVFSLFSFMELILSRMGRGRGGGRGRGRGRGRPMMANIQRCSSFSLFSSLLFLWLAKRV